MHKMLDFDNITLISRHKSRFKSRDEIDIGFELNTPIGPVPVGLPIINAPMKDSSGPKISIGLAKQNCISLIHRFQSQEDQYDQLEESINGVEKEQEKYVGCAVGLKDWEDRLEIMNDNGLLPLFICLDTANSHSEVIEQEILRINQVYPDIFLIAGNIHTSDALYDISYAIDACRVGTSGGGSCMTRYTTGIYRSCIDSIEEMIKNRALNQPYLIADGGINSPDKFCKAIAIGADFAMCGQIFASCEESENNTIKGEDGRLYKLYRGSSSYSIKKEMNDQTNYVEGTEKLVSYTGPLSKTLNSFKDALKSSMSYANASTLEEYRKNIEILEI